MGSPYGSENRRNEAFSVCDVHDASTSTIGPLYRPTLRRIVSAYRPHTLRQYFPFSSAYLLYPAGSRREGVGWDGLDGGRW